MSQAAEHSAVDHGAVLADPLFRIGYGEVFAGQEQAINVCWSEAERCAYMRGRQFGAYVRLMEEEKVPLKCRGMAHPDAVRLLILAMRGGDVL